MEDMAPDSEETKTARKEDEKRKGWVRSRGLSSLQPFMRLCRECGVPHAVSENHLWEEHGRILSRDATQRLIIVERRIIDGILSRISDRLGKDVESSFIYAKAFDASHGFRSLFSGWSKVSIGYPLFKKPFYEFLCDKARILGMADARVVRFKRGKEVTIACTQCYNKAFSAGDILGAVYAADGRRADVEITEGEGETIFTVTIQDVDEFPELDRYSFNWEVPLPGHINYKRCARCGTPFAVSFFSWDIPKGLMIDTHNGEAVALLDVAGINAAHNEIKSSYGAWIDDFLAQQVKEMVDEILPRLEWKRRRQEEIIRDLFFLAYRGMGNPIFTEPTENGIMARVENPFNYPLVAGITASFLSRGKPVTFEWNRSMPGRLELSLHFL